MPNIIEGTIDENQCIGDSLDRINNNFTNLDTKFYAAYACELSGAGEVGRFMSYGSNSTNHTGLCMPYDGVLLKAAFRATSLTNVLTIEPAINGTTDSDYALTLNGTNFTGDVISNYIVPLSFEAGDVLGWKQITLPDSVSSFNVNYIVRFTI